VQEISDDIISIVFDSFFFNTKNQHGLEVHSFEFSLIPIFHRDSVLQTANSSIY